jgi:predicted RND superfamily exporter protein
VVDFAERLLGNQRLFQSTDAHGIALFGFPPHDAAPEWSRRLTQGLMERTVLGALRTLSTGQVKSIVGNFWNADAQRMRLILRVQEQRAVEGKAVLVQDVTAVAKKHLGPSAQPTGIFVLLVFLIETLVADQWTAVAVSAGGVVVMASLAFRSLRLGLVAFAPKIVLVFAVIGTMGWLGLKVNVATAMIGSVSMGLVVAFSVPYLSRFLQERRAGTPFYTALSRTHGSAGKAMVFANLALMLGFLVLGFSRFVPTVHFGLLVSVAILGGVVGNLVLLPVLLRLVYLVPAPGPSDSIWELEGKEDRVYA